MPQSIEVVRNRLVEISLLYAEARSRVAALEAKLPRVTTEFDNVPPFITGEQFKLMEALHMAHVDARRYHEALLLVAQVYHLVESNK